MKRFTETNKWRDPWFRKLSPTAKHLFQWLVDNCDNAGVIDLDLEAASFDIGEPVNENHVAEIESRLKRLSNGKFWAFKFIAFQYGTLSMSGKCVPHLRVLESLKAHGISYPVSEDYSTRVHTTLVPRVETTLKDSTGEDKEKEPDKEKERGVQGGEPNGLDLVFVRDLLSTYRRPAHSRLTHLEESTLAEIIREHPRYRDEWDIIVTLKKKEPRYFPQSLSRLLSSWQETLDRANSWVPIPDGKPVKPSIMERIINELPG